MNFEDTVVDSIRNYPSLYQGRNNVIDHLFFHIGNGFHWFNGEMISMEIDEPNDPDENRLSLTEAGILACREEPVRIMEWSVLSEFTRAPILELPDDITDSWVAGAMEALDLLDKYPLWGTVTNKHGGTSMRPLW